jgi:hypothetical protein
MRSLTAYHVSLANTVQAAAPRISVLATVQLVGIPQGQLVQARQLLTALHAMLVATDLAAAILASALVTVR